MEFSGNATPLVAADVVAVAAQLHCEPAAVWAVCDVESAGSGFLPDQRPRLLFEAHVFGKLTRHAFDRSHPNISPPPIAGGAARRRPRPHRRPPTARRPETMAPPRSTARNSPAWAETLALPPNRPPGSPTPAAFSCPKGSAMNILAYLLARFAEP